MIKELKKGMIVRDNGTGEYLIVLPVSKKDIKKGINADIPNYYGFRGFWYGRNPMKFSSYGKICELNDITIIRNDLCGISMDTLSKILDSWRYNGN